MEMRRCLGSDGGGGGGALMTSVLPLPPLAAYCALRIRVASVMLISNADAADGLDVSCI